MVVAVYLQVKWNSMRQQGTMGLSMNQYPVVNAKPRLGATVSPYTMLVIPTFEVMLQNKGRTKTATVGFDTGLSGAHLQIPASVATYLGITPTGTENRSDATQTFVAQTGTIESITVPGMAGCSINNAKVLFFQNAPFLIGNDFIRDVGAEFTYVGGAPRLKCNPVARSMLAPKSPIFMVSMAHRGKVIDSSAFFDTGWEGTDIAVPWSIANQLGLPPLRTVTARTHTGTVTLVKSKMDRLALQDLPACYVNGADVDILPSNSPIQKVIVGEGFMKKVNGRLGYDDQGAYFSCASADGKARAIGEGILPSDLFPIDRLSDVDPYLLGGMAILGLGVLGAAYLFATRNAS
jgi:predicted aspartyl protease